MSEWKAVAIEQARIQADLPINFSCFEIATGIKELITSYCRIYFYDFELKQRNIPLQMVVCFKIFNFECQAIFHIIFMLTL